MLKLIWMMGLGFSLSVHGAEKGELMHGFRLVRTEEVKEANGVARIYEHEKSGARLLYLSNDDDNKVFSISFRTPPADSTGLPHILEHSVLCGSRKFPSKEPFLELIKGSVNTFVNAMTGPDKTYYPVASRNDKDFRNLMDVYLDAVFFPNIHTDPLILKQEGWRYEFNEKTGALEYNGVVYSEMKGVYSSPDSVLWRRMNQELFPGGTYSHDSGGEPDRIPGLTQQQFSDFHRKYYHPANSYIYLYGNGNIEEHLKFLDEDYLALFERQKVDSDVLMPKGKPKKLDVVEKYSINKGDSTKNKAYLALAYGVGTASDPEFVFGMDVLSNILLQTEASPLKRTLMAAGLGQEIDGGLYDGIAKPVFYIWAKNTEPAKKAAFEKLVDKTLRELAKKGLDKKLIESSLNHTEFVLRELEVRRYPKGLVLGGWIIDSWSQGGDPLGRVKFEKIIAAVREKAFSGYFEELIKKYLLSNSHRAVLVLKPEAGLDEKKARAQAKKLAQLAKRMKPAELGQIKKIAADLKKKQQTPDSAEVLAKIPLLEIKDINPQAEILPLEERKIAGSDFLLHFLPTNGIGYVNLYFDSTTVPQEMLPWLSLLSEVLGKMDTARRSFQELSVESGTHLGGLDYDLMAVASKNSTEQYRPLFKVRAKALLPKFDRLFELVREVSLDTRFDDLKRLKEIIQETRTQFEQSLVNSGDRFATLRTESYFSATGKYRELTQGLSYFEFIKALDSSFDSKAGEIQAQLKRVSELVFNRRNLRVGLTLSEADLPKVQAGFEKFLESIPSKKLDTHSYSFKLGPDNEAMVIPSKVQYVSQGGDYRKAGHEFLGSLGVLKNVLSSDFLWNRVRVQGGAYGARVSMARDGSLIFTSYRDPNIKETYENYSQMTEYLKGFNVSDREMTKYVLGTVSALDMPMTPSQKGETSEMNFFAGLTQKEIQKARNEVLSARQADIRKHADLLEGVLKQGYVSVVGGESKIQENKSKFKKVFSVLK